MKSAPWRKPTVIVSAAALLASGVAVAAKPSSGGASKSQRAQSADRPDFAAARDAYDAALANALGIDVAKLRAAQKAAREQMFLDSLDAQVKAGHLTQAQADELRAAAKAGTLAETLRSQRRARIAERLAADVKAGRITQAQADALLKAFDAEPTGGPEHLGPPRGFGRGGPWHRHGGGGRDHDGPFPGRVPGGPPPPPLHG